MVTCSGDTKVLDELQMTLGFDSQWNKPLIMHFKTRL